jgi:hypothetical protein
LSANLFRVFTIHRNITYNLHIIFRISQSKAMKRKLKGPSRGARRRHRRLAAVDDARAPLR